MATAAQETDQISEWTGSFGREYTDRNTFTPAELDALYDRNYGITRRELNRRFLEGIPSCAHILEVGCNVGNQLLVLEEMGFTNLYGIEIQSYALELARSRVPDVKFTQASVLAIPYPDQNFDLDSHRADGCACRSSGNSSLRQDLGLGFGVLRSAHDRGFLSRT